MKLNAEIISLLLRMRRLIRDEFGSAPSLQDENVVEKFYGFGTRSQQADLRELAEQLAATTSRASTAVIEPPAQPILPLAATGPSGPGPGAPGRVARPVSPVAPPREPTPAPRPAALVVPLQDPGPPPASLPTTPAPAVRPSLSSAKPEAAPSASQSILDLFATERFAQPTRIRCPGVPPFVIDAPQQRCLLVSVFKDLLPLKDADIRTVRCEPLAPQALQEAEKGANVVSLKSFWWFCGRNLSHRLMHSIASWEGFKLDRWPDFEKLSPSRHQVRLSTVLVNKPSSFEGLVQDSEVPQEEAIAFLNTAFLCRWLVEAKVVRSASPAAPETSAPSRNGIISRIRMRLGLTR